MKKKDPKEKFEIIEHDLLDEVFDDQHYDMEAEINIPRLEQTTIEAEATRAKWGKKATVKKERKNKFGWAFFLSAMFIGVGLTATFETPLGIFLGMGIGFLFFVDPIYNKVMDKIDKF
ncbi:MAG: hypothetical protein AAF587_00750 [Bacteroidota bacterium]